MNKILNVDVILNSNLEKQNENSHDSKKRIFKPMILSKIEERIAAEFDKDVTQLVDSLMNKHRTIFVCSKHKLKEEVHVSEQWVERMIHLVIRHSKNVLSGSKLSQEYCIIVNCFYLKDLSSYAMSLEFIKKKNKYEVLRK